jgi:nucleoside phosphorylase
MIVCAGDIEEFSFATPIGVGLVNSAVNLTRLCIMDVPEYILFVGTAGSYGKREIFEMVESKTAANLEHGFLMSTAYTPLDNVVSASDDVSRETIVNSSNYITTDREISGLYLEKGVELENMEFFSVLAVAKEFDIPAGGLFCVTNYCYENAHEEFMRNRAEAMDRIGEYLLKRAII